MNRKGIKSYPQASKNNSYEELIVELTIGYPLKHVRNVQIENTIPRNSINKVARLSIEELQTAVSVLEKESKGAPVCVRAQSGGILVFQHAGAEWWIMGETELVIMAGMQGFDIYCLIHC